MALSISTNNLSMILKLQVHQMNTCSFEVLNMIWQEKWAKTKPQSCQKSIMYNSLWQSSQFYLNIPTLFVIFVNTKSQDVCKFEVDITTNKCNKHKDAQQTQASKTRIANQYTHAINTYPTPSQK